MKIIFSHFPYYLFSKLNENQYTNELFDLTSKLLEINPEQYSIWNERKIAILVLNLVDQFDPFFFLKNTNNSTLIFVVNDIFGLKIEIYIFAVSLYFYFYLSQNNYLSKDERRT